MPESIKLSRKEGLTWLSIIICLAIIWMIPTNEIFNEKIQLFLMITIATIIIFATEIMDNLIPSLLLPLLYVTFNLVPAPVAFSPWSTDIPWMVLGGFLFASVLDRTGLLKRIVYWIIIKTGATYRGIIFGLILLAMIPFVSTIPMATITYGICKALDLGKSRASAGIMMAAACGVLTRGFFIYTPGNLGILLGISKEIQPLPMDYGTFLFQNLVFVPLVFVLGWVASVMMKPEKPISGKDYFITARANLGPMNPEEKKCALVSFLLMIGLFTTHLTGISTVMIFAGGSTLLFLPIIGCGTRKDIQSVNFSMIVFICACMSIGAAATTLGIGKLIAVNLLPHLNNLSATAFLMGTWFFAVLLNFLLTPLAAMATFGALLTQTSLDLGINPYLTNYVFFQGLDQIIFPYEYALYMIFFSFGLIPIKDFMKFFGVKMLICGLFLFLIGIPYWHLIHLL